jgi:hypothetical protein
MLYTIESTFGGFGDVLVEIFALPKACHSGSVGVKYLITDIHLDTLSSFRVFLCFFFVA